MSSPRMMLPTLIPESAPFSAEQRVWLNGLFAGLLALEPGVTPLSLEQAAAVSISPGPHKETPPSKTTTHPGTIQPWNLPSA
jgi:sulfite reductase (NADPH) flavoprotein alpha-component